MYEYFAKNAQRLFITIDIVKKTCLQITTNIFNENHFFVKNYCSTTKYTVKQPYK